ncbi:gluconate 2-dehydrogenase subunit 3 family protein [Nitratireductor sp. XY-223]|uniref:gluconate 2-dehydrogenase subunit 3 family protein n=1 Tax=Nitratireductor sp. XY-223 TaxID=2561926 RepID=UPI001FED5D19|nr:gluconate 2-dehydrogenase subunit 3 family protein [Nitratireductor sp. XY-223]
MLGSASFAALSLKPQAHGATVSGALPWKAFSADPPEPVPEGQRLFFTEAEAELLSAIADRIVPADELSVSASEAGCVTFIDAQLMGSYGSASRLYMNGPFEKGLATQGYQGSQTPAERYRAGLAAIAAHVEAQTPGKAFAAWSADEQDALLKELEADKVTLPDGVDGQAFFELMLKNVMEGFFADPVYGGNRDMAGWKMVGFPGARYDYRPFVGQHNQPYPFDPMSIMGNADWVRKGG